MEKCASVSVSPCEAVFAESMADFQNKLFQQSTSILSHLAMQTSVKNTQIHRYTNSQSQSDIFYLTWQCKYFSHILAISLCHNEMAQAVYLRQIHAIPIQCIKCKCINWSSVIKWEAHFSKTCGVLTKYIYAGRRRRQGGDIVRRQPLCQIKSSEVDIDEEDDDDDDGEGDDHDDSRLYVLIHLRQYCQCGGQTWDREIMPSVYVDARSVFIWSKNDPMQWLDYSLQK